MRVSFPKLRGRFDKSNKKDPSSHQLPIGLSTVKTLRSVYQETEKKRMMKSSRKLEAKFGAAFRSISFCFLAVLVLQSEAFNANRPTLRPVVPLDQSSRTPLTSYRNVKNSPVTLLRAKNDICVDVVSFARDDLSNCFDRRGGFSHQSLFSLKKTHNMAIRLPETRTITGQKEESILVVDLL